MRLSLPISILLHAAILAWALHTVHSARDVSTPVEIPVQVDLLTVAELDNMRAGNKDAKTLVKPVEQKKAKPDVKPADSEKKRVAALPPPPNETPDPPKKDEVKKDEPKKEEVKKEEPKKEEPKKEDPIAEALKKAEQDPPKKEEPKPEEKKKDEPKKAEAPKKEPKKSKLKEKFDTTKVAALLNKLPNAATTAATKTNAATTKQKAQPVVGSSEATGTQLSASEQSLLRSMFDQQVQRCWTPPIGAREGAVIVTVTFRLRQDGSIEGQPNVLHGSNSGIFDAAARSAVYAVMACAPYQLPDKLYKSWREIEWEFDPSKALNG